MSINGYYKYSLLSNLSYVNWSASSTGTNATLGDLIQDADNAERLPGDVEVTPNVIDTLGEKIFIQEGWRVADYQENTEDTGFSASLFTKEATHEKVLAIRGTEPSGIEIFQDVIRADLAEIGFVGMALSQAVSLFNYIQKLKSKGGNVLSLELKISTTSSLGQPPANVETITVKPGIKIWLKPHYNTTGLGLISKDDNLTITGHSLGGHLAAFAERMFPDLFDQTITFNAPGFDPRTADIAGPLLAILAIIFPTGPLKSLVPILAAGAQQLTDEIFKQLFSPYLSNSVNNNGFAGLPITSLVSKDVDGGVLDSLVSSFLTGKPASPHIDITTERDSHLIGPIMDEMAVQDLLEKLNPVIGLNGARQLFMAASSNPGTSDEALLDAMSDILLPGTPHLAVNDIKDNLVTYLLGIGNSDFDTRTALHTRIIAIEQAIDGRGDLDLHLSSLANMASADLVSIAQDNGSGMALRYALQNLNPFTIEGLGPTEDAKLYKPFNKNQELDIGNYSQEYLKDRSDFLTLKIELNKLNQEHKNGARNIVYMDMARDGYSLSITRPAGAGQGSKQRIVFANSKPDENITINGGDKNDHLYGFLGDDILAGAGGADYLEGGAGNDRLFNNDNNASSIDDSSQDIMVGGAGSDIYYAGLNDIIRDSDGLGQIWIENKQVSANNLKPVSGTTDIYTNNDPVNLTRFRLLQNGDLQLLDRLVTIEGFDNGDFGFNLDANAPPTGQALVGGTSGDDLDALNNAVNGTPSDEEIHGLDGNDDIFGYGGQDVLFGEEGNDRLISEEGNDVLSGGDGDDILISKAGKDILQGNAGADLLVAGVDDDFLEGGGGQDALAGGAGTDTLFGGDGNDILWGDGTYSVPDRHWNVTVTNPSAHFLTVELDGIIGEISSSDDQADLLDGGAGDDVLLGAGGNDQLYGRDGNDFLIGGDGADRLEGGTGNDNLLGDDESDLSLIGNDILLGGAGNDFLLGGYGDDELDGGSGDDEIQGDYADDDINGGNDSITGGTGNDTVLAGAGNDIIDAGGGNDTVDAGPGDDIILAGEGLDNVKAGDGNDTILGDAGADTLEGNAGDDSLDGGDDNDVLFGNEGNDVLNGDGGQDTLLGGIGDDTLSGGEDNDQLSGGDGDDAIHGDGGNDALFGGKGNDLLYGDAGNDRLQGGAGNDQLYGGDGADLLIGQEGNDTLFGGSGNDELQGNEGGDVLQGEAGNDHLFGQSGDDVLNGGDDDDELQGGDGNDFIYGGPGVDTLIGGLGNDTYQYNRGDGPDVLLDDGGDDDALNLGPDITSNDLRLTTQGSDLTVILLDEEGLPANDSITLADWLNPAHRVESIQFSDGTVLDITAIQSRLPETIALKDGLNAQGSGNVTTYNFTPGPENPDGFSISVSDTGGLDALQFKQASLVDLNTLQIYYATPSLSRAGRDGNDLVLDIHVDSETGTIPAGSGQIRLQDYYTPSGFIEAVTFPDGTALNDPAQAPVVAVPVSRQIAPLNTGFSYSLDPGIFSDGPYDVLTYAVTLADGSDLPDWLSFDSATRTLSGTPAANDAGILELSILARDSTGQTATAGLEINAGNINLPPVVANYLGDQSIKAREEFTFTLPGNTFLDRNASDSLIYSATAPGGVPLPDWLSFEPQAGKFSGVPSDLDVGHLEIEVTATDSDGMTAEDSFVFSINPYNSAPVANPDFVTLRLGSQVAASNEFLINTTTTHGQFNPAVSSLVNGGFVALWQDDNENSIFAQLYDNAGTRTGAELTLLSSSEPMSRAAVSPLMDGGFVIAWRGGGFGGPSDIYVRQYDINANPVGQVISVASNPDNGTEELPVIAGLADGGYVAAWSSYDSPTGDGSGLSILAQRFAANGNKVGAEFLVNSTTSEDQFNPDITALTDGGFVITWENNSNVVGDTIPARGQRFDAQGNAAGSEFVIGAGVIPGIAENPKVAALMDGGFVVTMTNNSDIYAQTYDASGVLTESIHINESMPFDYSYGEDGYELIGLENGGFMVTWQSDNTTGQDVVAARVDVQGGIATFLVNNNTAGLQANPDVSQLSDGSLAFAWRTSDPATAGLDGSGIAGRIIPVSQENHGYLIDVLANDTDPDPGDNASTFILTDAVIREGTGNVSVYNNQIRLIPGDGIGSLGAGQSARTIIDYTMSDLAGVSASSTLTLILNGVEVIPDMNPSEGATLQGGGILVNGGEDINGDGFTDILVADPGTNSVHGILGQAGSMEGVVSLAAVSSESSPAGFTFEGGISTVTSIDTTGDVNGDGVSDIIIGAPVDAALLPGDTPGPGHAYVVFGNAQGLSSTISPDDLDGSSGFVISGRNEGDMLGSAAAMAGDINGDGMDDIIIGIPGAVNNITGTIGEAAVIFGQGGVDASSFDVGSLDGSNGFVISGMDSLGATVSTAGDVNGDGFNDVIIGAPDAVDAFSGLATGSVYVIYGRGGDFSPILDVRGLSGSNGFTFSGLESGDNVGSIISSAGDINADGFDDLLIADNSTLIGNGTSICSVVFGGGTKPAQLNELFNNNSFIVPGTISSLSGAGDVNGDGFDDILVGMSSDGNGSAGDAYLIFGHSGNIDFNLDLESLDGTDGIHFTGLSAGDLFGYSTRGVGDINGDGFDDILMGAPGANSGNGESYLIYGRDFRDEASLIGSNNNDIINIVNSGQTVFALSGNDIINVSDVANVTLHTGAGDDAVKLVGVDNAIIDTGAGNNRVSISGSSNQFSASQVSLTGNRKSSNHISVSTVANGGDVVINAGFNGGGGQVYDTFTDQEVAPEDIYLRKGSMVVDILDGQVEYHFMDVDTDHLLGAPAPFKEININNSMTLTYDSLLSRGFDIEGTPGDDVLNGTEVTDRITGLGGDDLLNGGDGDDILTGGDGADELQGGFGSDSLDGGAGDDILQGGIGDDTYLYHAGDGKDTLSDIGGIDQVIFGPGISPESLSVAQLDNNLVMGLSEDDQLIITDWFANADRQIERFAFTSDDLTLLSANQVEELIGVANQPPAVAAGIGDQATDEDAPFSFTIPVDAFTDPDPGDVLSYDAANTDGGVLPAWLAFDAATRTFSGIPDNNDVGETGIAVTVTDLAGEMATDSFRVVVNNVNDAPILLNPIDDQVTDEDAPFSFTVPEDAFRDDDIIHGDTSTFSVSLADEGVLPAWLQFDQLTRTLSGTPANNDVGVDELQVTITDGGGLTASDVFSLTVNNVNDAPVLQNPISDQEAREGDAWKFSVPAATFDDIDVGDNLKLTAALQDGSALPDWLTFQTETGEFTGEIPFNAAGTYLIEVTATDQVGARVSDVFKLAVTNVINGNHNNNYLSGTDGNDIINGFRGNDKLFGKAGDDVLNGGRGNDVLFGGTGDDVLQGGAGNDRLYGGAGDDVYEYKPGDGRDTIGDSGGNDTLRFGSGIDPDGLEVWRYGWDLLIDPGGHHDSIVIDNWYRDSGKLESFEFNDGTVLVESQIQQLVQNMSWFGIHPHGHIDPVGYNHREEYHSYISVNSHFK